MMHLEMRHSREMLFRETLSFWSECETVWTYVGSDAFLKKIRYLNTNLLEKLNNGKLIQKQTTCAT